MNRRPIKGFTLIEGLIVLAVLAVLFTFSIPFINSVQKSAAQNETARIFHALQLARLEAVKRNTLVNVCGIDDFGNCSENWSKGYKIFTKDHRAVIHEVKLQGTLPIHSKNLNEIRFSKEGFCLTRGTVFVGDGADQKRMIIYDSGRVRVSS